MVRVEAVSDGLGWRGSAFQAFRDGAGANALRPRLDERRRRLADAADALAVLAGRLDELGQRALGLRRSAQDLGLFEPAGAEPLRWEASGSARVDQLRWLRRDHLALLEDHRGALEAATEALASLEPPATPAPDEPATPHGARSGPTQPAGPPARSAGPSSDAVSSAQYYAVLDPSTPTVDVAVGHAEMAGEPGWLTYIVPGLAAGVEPAHRLGLLADMLAGSAGGTSGRGAAGDARST